MKRRFVTGCLQIGVLVLLVIALGIALLVKQALPVFLFLLGVLLGALVGLYYGAVGLTYLHAAGKINLEDIKSLKT